MVVVVLVLVFVVFIDFGISARNMLSNLILVIGIFLDKLSLWKLEVETI